VHGIETCSPHTWIAYERDSDPRGREVNWLVDEDMLHHVIPQARIWAFDYNSRYSNEAQVVRIKDLAGVFLGFIKDRATELAARPIVFIGSCFGGIVVAQASRGHWSVITQTLETQFPFFVSFHNWLNASFGSSNLTYPYLGASKSCTGV
jgi:hypothetical protein